MRATGQTAGTDVRVPHAVPKALALTQCANTDRLASAVADQPWKRDLRGKPLFTWTEERCPTPETTSTELIDARVNLRLRHEHRFLPVIPRDGQLPSVTRVNGRQTNAAE